MFTFLLLAVLLALFVGGLVAGRFAISSAELNGTVVGIVVAAVPLAWLLGSIASVLGLIGDPGDAQARSENLGMLGAALVAYLIVSPIAVMTSFWGGRVGGCSGRPSLRANNRRGT